MQKKIFSLFETEAHDVRLALAREEGLARLLRETKSSELSGGLRLWSSSLGIVLGRTCRAKENIQKKLISKIFQELEQQKNQEENVPKITRRLSGGGTVLHGDGSLNYSIFLRLEKELSFLSSVPRSYSVILGILKKALLEQGIVTEIRGQSDLVIVENANSFKISGNAQFRKFGLLVFHGTLLLSSSFIKKIKEILPHPPKEPLYRALRSHETFLRPLSHRFNKKKFHTDLQNSLRTELYGDTSTCFVKLHTKQKKALLTDTLFLFKSKYQDANWILRGKSPR